METFYFALAIFLLLNLGAGMWRVLHGPTPADRMMAVQLFGTTAVATLLLLAQATATSAVRDTALMFALLAAISAVAFVRRTWPEEENRDDTA